MLGVNAEYEGRGYMFNDGTCYSPDFYMPDIDTFFEVKGVMDEYSEQKIAMLAIEHGRVIVGRGDGSLLIYERDGDECYKTDANLLVCSKCGTAHFSPHSYDEECPNGQCGASWKQRSAYGNVFDAVGWSYA